jgi:hypothetical protein
MDLGVPHVNTQAALLFSTTTATEYKQCDGLHACTPKLGLVAYECIVLLA